MRCVFEYVADPDGNLLMLTREQPEPEPKADGPFPDR